MPSTGPSASKKQQEVPKLSPQEIDILVEKAKRIREKRVATQGYQDIGYGYSVMFKPKDAAANPPRNTDYYNITGQGIGPPASRGADAFKKLLTGQVGDKRPSEQPAAVRRRPTPRCRTPLLPLSPSYPSLSSRRATVASSPRSLPQKSSSPCRTSHLPRRNRQRRRPHRRSC